jgi:multidrug efflux system outer membrane protein
MNSKHSRTAKNRHARHVIGVAAICVLAGCTVGPDYHRPAPLVASANLAPFTVEGVEWNPANPSAHLPRGEWWNIFSDAELNRLEALAAKNNQTLAANLAALEQARALVRVARSDFYPQISFDPAYARQRTSFNAVREGKPANAAYTYNSFALPLELGWEVDLWGRVRRQTEAARARMNAATDDVESARLVVQSEIAGNYFTLCAVDAELKLLADTVETYNRSLNLTRNRRQGGIASDLDVSQAETQLRTAQAQIPPVRLQCSQILHALATLCGRSATDFAIAEKSTTPTDAPQLPAVLPGKLLERRPDVAAAEQRMAAANADIGLARAAFFPRLSFNGLAGLQSVSASTILTAPSRYWSIGPTIDLPLFTGGRNTARLEATRAAYNQTLANYRQTVLNALQDVEDQLSAQQLLIAQLEGETAALRAARRTLEIANNRYKAGLITYLEVASAQSLALEHERTVVRLAGQQRIASVSLIKALGGGWSAAL